jgi:hypothetical protein
MEQEEDARGHIYGRGKFDKKKGRQNKGRMWVKRKETQIKIIQKQMYRISKKNFFFHADFTLVGAADDKSRRPGRWPQQLLERALELVPVLDCHLSHRGAQA